MSNREYASKQLNKIDFRIQEAAELYGRDKNSITLIGAAKQQSSQLISDFHEQGLAHVGENYLNEALEKQSRLRKLDLKWHFIGKVQSNKAKQLAQSFDLIHGIGKRKHAQQLAKHVPANSTLSVLVQLNLDNEDSKGGVSEADCYQLCAEIAEMENLRLDGFMLIPRARETIGAQRVPFAKARELLFSCNQRLGIDMQTLSMGMSNDLEAAIAEGSTMIRVGTDLFGARN